MSSKHEKSKQAEPATDPVDNLSTENQGEVDPTPSKEFAEPAVEELEPVAEAVEPSGEELDDAGRVSRGFITCKDFYPGGRQNNLLELMLKTPEGEVQWLGTMSGWVTKAEDKITVMKDQRGEREVRSVALHGSFRIERADQYGELEVRRSPVAYLTTALGDEIKEALALTGEGARITLDCEVGAARVTRGFSSFEWRIRQYGDDPVEAEHRAIKARQRARELRRQQRRMISGKRAGGVPVLDLAANKEASAK